jgi:hypothetical protein
LSVQGQGSRGARIMWQVISSSRVTEKSPAG